MNDTSAKLRFRFAQLRRMNLSPLWGGAVVLAAVAVIGVACVDIPLGDGPRKRMLRDVAENVIAEDHAELAVRAAALRDAVDALVTVPDQQRLDEAQRAWRVAREPWQRSLVFRVGPVLDQLFDARIDQWPVDRARIEAEIAGTAELTTAYVGGLGANKKGFHAVEELLFDEAGDAAVLAALTTGTNADRRRTYVLAAATILANDAAALNDAWRADGGGFVVRISDIGGAGPFANVKEATDAVVNEMVFLSEFVADGRLGKPMGKANGGVPQIDQIVSLPSDGAIDDMLANLDGIEAAFEGTDSGGLGALVERASPTTARRVRNEIAAARAAISAIPRPFAASVAAQAPEVEAAWQAARALRLTISTETIAVLGATLSFNSNDGD
jgi:predicted lipoprotein